MVLFCDSVDQFQDFLAKLTMKLYFGKETNGWL